MNTLEAQQLLSNRLMKREVPRDWEQRVSVVVRGRVLIVEVGGGKIVHTLLGDEKDIPWVVVDLIEKCLKQT